MAKPFHYDQSLHEGWSLW